MNFQQLLQTTLVTKNKLQYYLQKSIDLSVLHNLANKLNLQLVEDTRDYNQYPYEVSKPREEDCCTL